MKNNVYINVQKAIRVHVDDEDKTTAPIQGTAYETRAIFINESGSLLAGTLLEAAAGEGLQTLGDSGGAAADNIDKVYLTIKKRGKSRDFPYFIAESRKYNIITL
jgi:hypothetical protein